MQSRQALLNRAKPLARALRSVGVCHARPQGPGDPGMGPGRPVDFYLGGCHFLALLAEISLVHDDLTRKTAPKHRQEPLCRGKLCLNRDI